METSSDMIRTGEMLAGISALLDAETPVAGSATERLNLALTAVVLRDRLAAVASRLVADAERADAGMAVAGMSVKNVLVHQLRHTPSAAAGLVRRSVALADRPGTLAAAQAGEVNAEQAGVIVKAVDALPADEVTAADIAAGEATLLGMAREFHAGGLKVLGGRLLEVIAPVEADRLEETRLERELRAAQQDRFLQFLDTGHGVTKLSGLLPTTSAALVRAQLDAYVAAARRSEHDRTEHDRTDADGGAAPSTSQAGSGLPDSASGPLPSRVSMGQRRADALVAMAEQCAAERLAPAIGGDRPRALVLMGYDRLLQTARDHAARLARHASDAGQGNTPTNAGAGAAADHVFGGVDGVAAQLVSGERVPAGVLRRWLCDAELLPVVLGGESQVLDVGRARRCATAAQRVALTVRDRGCVFPGCDVPAPLCEAHHIDPWATGGPTDLLNLALLCWHHHALCEPGRPARDQWLIEIRDGVPVAIPPARLDPNRTPDNTTDSSNPSAPADPEPGRGEA